MRLKPSLPEEDPLEEPLLNLTPLLDVVFVVLITFMIIAPILNRDLIELAPGGPNSKQDISQNALAIQLRSDDSIWIGGKRVSFAELENFLALEKKKSPRQIPQLIPDKNVHFGTYQRVKNALELCGFESMEIVLEPQ